MRIGIFAKTFPGREPGLVLRAARAAGYDAVQYNLACSGLEPAPLDIPEAAARAVARAAQDSGVAIAALSGTVNLAHPDPGRRADALARLLSVIAAAPRLGAPIVTLCSGSRDPDDQWRAHPENRSAAAWRDLRLAMESACAAAEAAGVRLGIEPEPANVVGDAAAARRLIDELSSPAPAVVLDPANLIDGAADPGAVIAAAVDLLADRIVLAHAKDRDAQGNVVAAGRGVIDFAGVIARLRAAGFDGDLIAHGLSAAEAAAAARHLRGAAG
jgi:sugar phosphate isomerase/epimerase